MKTGQIGIFSLFERNNLKIAVLHTVQPLVIRVTLL